MSFLFIVFWFTTGNTASNPDYVPPPGEQWVVTTYAYSQVSLAWLQAASMGAVLLAAGAKDKRYALPNARSMIHQPLAGMQGTAEEILIHATEFQRIKTKLNEILIKHTGQSMERIAQDTDRDRFMSADEAVAYGLIDKAIESMPRVENAGG